MELNGDHVPETEEYGISSTVLRARKPFHRGRLREFVTEGRDSGAYGQVLRFKGFFSPAGRGAVSCPWSQAGTVARFEPSPPGAQDGESGQGQELVLIGTGLCPEALYAALEACLVGVDDTGPWRGSFPAWDVRTVDDVCEHEPARAAAPR